MSDPFVCRVGDVVRRGPAVSLAESVSARAVAEAVAEPPDPEDRIAVEGTPATAAHAHVCCIRPGMGLRTRTALARAARTRDRTTPHDETIERVSDELASLGTGDAGDRPDGGDRTGQTDSTTVRAQGEDIDALRERVATARGRLQARRANGLDPTPAAEALSTAIAALSEAETATAARRQRRAKTRTEAQSERDHLETRLRLEDRLANLERQARSHLVEQVEKTYRDCLHSLPDHDPGADHFETAAVPAALAITRLASVRAPVVLAVDRFDSAAAAAEWLDTPVIQV